MALFERYRGRTVPEALSHRATTDPEGVFLIAGDRRSTFGEVDGQSEALAAALANLGVEPGDRVAVVLPSCPEFVVAFFALAKLGAVLVPLDPRLTQTELQYILRHSEAVCAVTVEAHERVDFLQLFEDLVPRLPALQYLVTVGEEDLWYDDRVFQFEDLISAGTGRNFEASRSRSPDDLLAIVYTSGTTGKPKGVELTHQNLIYAAAATADAVRLEAGDRVIGVTAVFHVFGLGPGILGCLLGRASLVLQEDPEAASGLDLVAEHGATVHYGVPTVFAAALREQRTNPRDLSSLRVGLVAGAPMPENLLREVEEELCPQMLTAYSLTETASTLAVTTIADSQEKRQFTVGRAVEGTQVRVVTPAGEILPSESLGEIEANGPGVMRGYYRQPLETSQTLGEDGFLRTGDLGIVDEDGYIHLVGRREDVIIRGGSNIYPREVEDRLHAHPAVREVAVVGITDELLGEAICAFVIPVEGAIVTGEELRDWCRRTLATHKIPDEVRFLDAFPMTGTGKVRRMELARLYQDGRSEPAY